MATIRKLRGRWQAQVRRRGTMPRAKSFDTRAEAERWARELEAEVDRCGVAPDTRINERTTLGEILRRYQVEISPTKRGAAQEVQRIAFILRHPIAHRTLAGLSAAHIASYRDERLSKVAPSTTLRELAVVSHALEVARRDWGFPLSQNVAKLIRKPSVANARDRRVHPDEMERLLAGCNDARTPYLRPLIVFAVETAMRRGELISLTWADVDLDKRVAKLRLTKNGSGRVVPLSSRAVEAVQMLLPSAGEGAGPVFSVSAGALEQAWRRLCARCQVTDLRFHDLRHEAISRLVERGLGVMEVASISGHRELRMLSRYTHLRGEDLVARLG